jgi:lysozyme family protein
MATDSRFEACLPFILKEEGGDDDDPHDHGGRTSRGITQREYSPWRARHGLPDRDVFEASTQEIHDVYYEEYWLPCGPNLHPGVDLVYFNFAVNAGAGEAHKLLMRSIGPDDVDDDAQTINRMCNEGEAFYRGLAQFPRYGRGWTARTEHIRAAALKMQAEFPVTTPQPQPQETIVNPLIIVEILSKLPTLVKAVQDILASDAAHTIESAVAEWAGHNTKGQPNSPALSPK